MKYPEDYPENMTTDQLREVIGMMVTMPDQVHLGLALRAIAQTLDLLLSEHEG